MTILEKDILVKTDHPFLVGMDYLYMSKERLYFVLPFIEGGEMFKILKKAKRFSE